MRFRIENKSKKGNLYPTRYTRRQEGRGGGRVCSRWYFSWVYLSEKRRVSIKVP